MRRREVPVNRVEIRAVIAVVNVRDVDSVGECVPSDSLGSFVSAEQLQSQLYLALCGGRIIPGSTTTPC